jgi:ADP-ribose pyrophosphatase
MNEHLLETVISTKQIFKGRVIGLRLDEVVLPNGSGSTREVVEHPGAVAVVPLCSDGRIVLVRQYRHAVSKVLLEIPAGKLDKNEDPQLCAIRELEEETGYLSNTIRKLATVYTTPGFTNEIIYLYTAEKLAVTKQKTDEDEFIDIEHYTPGELRKMIRRGEIEDAKTLLGLSLAGVLA